jgi:transposase InsO family protein
MAPDSTIAAGTGSTRSSNQATAIRFIDDVLNRLPFRDQEFYQLLDQDGVTDDIHLFNAKLRGWEDYYNYHRPHGALNGQTPYERLMAKTRAGVLPGQSDPTLAKSGRLG